MLAYDRFSAATHTASPLLIFSGLMGWYQTLAIWMNARQRSHVRTVLVRASSLDSCLAHAYCSGPWSEI